MNVFSDNTWKTVCLRGGAEWHREILRDMEDEVRDKGFDKALVEPAGGALVRYKNRNEFVLYGFSDDYGECDKQLAGSLLQEYYPALKIWIRS